MKGYAMDLKKLHDPFPASAISWRIQGKPQPRNGKFYGLALAYIDARDVQDRLDEVCKPENWQTQFVETPKGRILCSLSIRIGDTWVTKTDGAGDTDVEGEKGAISDALKRAAVSWGVGRYLYATKSPYVECQCSEGPKGLQFKKWIGDPAKLAGLPDGADLPDESVSPSPAQNEKPKQTPAQVADLVIERIKAQNTLAELNALLDPEKGTMRTWDALKQASPSDAARIAVALTNKENALAGAQ